MMKALAHVYSSPPWAAIKRAQLGGVRRVILDDPIEHRSLVRRQRARREQRLVELERRVLERLRRAQQRHVVDDRLGQGRRGRGDADPAGSFAALRVGAAGCGDRAERQHEAAGAQQRRAG